MAKIRNRLPQTIGLDIPHRREVYLDYCVKNNNWQIGCEVGVRFGRVLFYLLDNNPRLKMYAVDKDIKQFYNQAIADRYKGRLVVLEGQSAPMANHILERLDFVFIDASHSVRDVKQDIEVYSRLLNNLNGLTGHDADYPSVQEGLKQAKVEFDVGPDNIWHYKSSV